MTNCLYLHDSYISKLEFMNYLFANLLVAWLYVKSPIISWVVDIMIVGLTLKARRVA